MQSVNILQGVLKQKSLPDVRLATVLSYPILYVFEYVDEPSDDWYLKPIIKMSLFKVLSVTNLHR